ncbi:spore germination protein GerPC [Hazenella coriacea]|uniref:Spore germination protein GerPC n=2 Tax=Hazenella coriacea TaxID=1179467 RepID=A0A4R3L0X0_9BACL|nr:spore germination protein GerPC [Hazenella coriacea]
MYDANVPYWWARLQQLEDEIAKLNKESQELKEMINNLKPIQIDKMEYKIHELHVQTLSGTLNVGLSANGDETCMSGVIDQIMKEHQTENSKEGQEANEGGEESAPSEESTVEIDSSSIKEDREETS